MKRFFIYLFLICGIFCSIKASAVEELKNIAVFSLDVPVSSSSYSIYSNTQDMFAADLVNSLQSFNDMKVLDIYSSKKILQAAGLANKYEKMVKEYKQRYTIDYDEADKIATTLGVDYIVFVYGGFDTEKSFLKSNWKYRCQWIWASPVKPSAQLNINTTLIDTKKHSYILEENVKKDFAIDNFAEPSQSFGENIVPISQIKKFTRPSAQKVAKKIHDTLYPDKNTKFSQKDAFIEKFTPNSTSENYTDVNNSEISPANNATPAIDNVNPAEVNSNDSIMDARKENYRRWVQERL